jgi:hypothetical protein
MSFFVSRRAACAFGAASGAPLMKASAAASSATVEALGFGLEVIAMISTFQVSFRYLIYIF